jgi:hypothetical protein
MDRKPLLLASLAMSVLSVVLCTYTLLRQGATADEEAIRSAVESALRDREHAFVEKHRVQFTRIFEDFRLELSPSERNPQTVSDLLSPMLRLVTGVSGSGARKK